MSESGEEHIDPRLVALMKKSEKDGGILLKDVSGPDESVVEVYTQNSLYEIAIIDVEKGEIAMRGGKYLPEPELSYLRGSTWGGSMTKVGWIGVGMRLEANCDKAGLLSTSAVKTVKVKRDKARADLMRERAKATARPVMSREEAEAAIRSFMEESFPTGVRTHAQEMVDRFSLNGQIAIATLLRYAHEQEKFDAAMKLLEKFYREHWVYQHPEVRGDPGFTTVNAAYLERAYQEIDMKMPNE